MKKYLLLPILSIFTVCAFAESAISVSPVRWDEAEAKADALLAQMTDEEKDFVLGVRDDGTFFYKTEYQGKKVGIWEDEESKFPSPEFFHVDPLSGREW